MNRSFKDAPILFLFGPSGVGKTTLAEWMKEELNFLHIKIDRADGDGIDIEDLRNDWEEYLNNQGATSLARTIRARLSKEGKVGAVLTFRSTDWLQIGQIEEAQSCGIQTVVLYGSKEDCLKAFLVREEKKRRNIGKDHWIKHNEKYYVKYESEDYDKYREQVFTKHQRRSKGELLEAISRRILID